MKTIKKLKISKNMLFMAFSLSLCLIFIYSSNHTFSRSRAYEIIIDTVLTPGIIYRNVIIGRGRNRHSVHIVETDLINPACSIAVLKAHGQVNELEKLHYMINRFDTVNTDMKVIAAINANFWRAYSNRPIGPTIINGEVVELMTHKKWTSGFFDVLSFLYIDTFFVAGSLISCLDTLDIRRVNRRHDSSGIVLYNRYGGDTIPYIPSKVLSDAFEKRVSEEFFYDSTEIELDTLGLKSSLTKINRQAAIEHLLSKVALKYLTTPAVNKSIPCLVISVIDSGIIAVPDNGCIISFGTDFNKDSIHRIGDTLILKFTTNIHDSIVFMNAVSGTPRLVRNGRAKEEARKEGSRGRRFIRKALPRTAIGTNKSKTKIYFVAIESGSKSKRTRGTSLQQLANVMQKIGCYDAMNLDGGGSTMMILDNRNVMRANPLSSRRISVGLGVVLHKLE